MEDSQTVLEIVGLEKSYGTVEVLKGIGLSLRKGEILGLVGENGAGKSTLVKCIGGRTGINGGSILFPQEKTNIYTIPQEFNLIPTLSVYENIFLGRELSAYGFLRKDAMRKRSEELLRKLKSNIDPDAMLSDLSVADKQMVEIAKAFLQESTLLIMDEPTTVLNQRETGLLFGIMKQFREHGGSILYISHKLEEVRTVCDRIAILRDGVLVSIGSAGDFTAMEIAQKMVGRELSKMFLPKIKPAEDAETVLDVVSLRSEDAVRDVSFSLKKGEILGIAGLAGAGRTELAETICALRPKTSGLIRLSGKETNFRNPAQAMAAGLSYLSEDRQGTAVLTGFSVAENMTLSSLKKYCAAGFMKKKRIREKADYYIRKFNVKTESAATVLSELSGGNQQKVAIAKGVDTEPSIFIFDEPTRGVDIGARSEIYQFIHSLADSGLSCILISSDLEEVIGNCGRVLVMRNGMAAGELSGGHVCEEEIMYLATGVK